MASSSTSSSEHGGFPWAGFASVLLVLVVDATLFGSFVNWSKVEEAIEPPAFVEMGVARGHRRLAELDELTPAEAERPLVFLVGSSRSARGIQEHRFPAPLLEAITLVDLACPGTRPYEYRSLVDDIRPHEPDLVVMLLSEFDTHGRMLSLAMSAAGSAGAVADVLAVTDFEFMLSRRESLLRLALRSQFNAYRFRSVFGAAGVTKLRVFTTAAENRSNAMRATGALLDGVSHVTYDRKAVIARTKELFPDVSERTMRTQVAQVNAVCRGEHQVVQEEMIRRACEELRAMGSDVLILEGPLNPVSDELYDVRTRDDFRALAAELERDLGVHTLMLADMPPFTPDQFADLTHLGPSGIPLYTASVAQAVATVLLERENAAK